MKEICEQVKNQYYKVGSSDCLILAESLYQETTLYTFDKKLAQAEHVKEVI